MPCGKRPLIKSWDKPRNIRVITPSRYEQNEPSVKLHWKKVMRDLELSYKDEQFWESHCNNVRELVGPTVFLRIAKIFHLPLEEKQYNALSEDGSPEPSETYYKTTYNQRPLSYCSILSDYETPDIEEPTDKEQSDQWSDSSYTPSEVVRLQQFRKSNVRSTKSLNMSKSKSFSSAASKMSTSKPFSKRMSKALIRVTSTKSAKSTKMSASVDDSTASDDDILVHPSSRCEKRLDSHRRRGHSHKNPHFDMLYCHESETDMIKWKSKYKQKAFEVSASDEFSKKAEIMTKEISKKFYEWWVALGNIEFKSEIKRPEDIEELFQVWFDEHASRGLVLDPKTLPCVIDSIAEYIREPKASCPNVLKRQIAYDIHAETSPAHVIAFSTGLPKKMKHIPPKNNTEAMWHSVRIPEDLQSMGCVWDDVLHLTSTKAFHKWLKLHPHLPMPPCLKKLDAVEKKKQLFVVPSDYYFARDRSISSLQELALPVSQFSIELKDVLSKIMDQ